MGSPFDVQRAAMEAAMQHDIDAHAQDSLQASGVRAPGGPLPPQPPQVQAQAPQAGVPGMFPQAMMQTMMQQFMQQLLLSMQQALPQVAPGTAPVGEAVSAAFSPQGAGWQEDRHLANVRLDERAFRRVEKFTDKREEWTEWRAQVLNAVRECDKTFADSLLEFEKKEEPITDLQLSLTQQQLSATLQSRLISFTGKEAFAIVTDCSRGPGCGGLATARHAV